MDRTGGRIGASTGLLLGNVAGQRHPDIEGLINLRHQMAVTIAVLGSFSVLAVAGSPPLASKACRRCDVSEWRLVKRTIWRYCAEHHGDPGCPIVLGVIAKCREPYEPACFRVANTCACGDDVFVQNSSLGEWVEVRTGADTNCGVSIKHGRVQSIECGLDADE